MKKNKKPTLKSIAEQLNISVTTVSRALAGYQDVNEKTRQQIEKVAQDLGYVPNLAARRLVTGKADAIGILLPVPYGDMRDHFLSNFLLHFGQALHAHDPNIDLVISYAPEGEQELNTYRRFIDSQRVDAFLVMRTRRYDPRVDLLTLENVPFVTHGRTENADKHNWVDTDAQKGFEQVTQYLIDQGHTSIVLLNFPERIFTSQLRAEGYESAMQRAHLPTHVVTTELTEGTPYKVALDLLQSDRKFTGFICASDVIAYEVIKAANTLGIDPMQELGIIGCDNLPVSSLSQPSITTLRSSFDAHSQALIEILDPYLKGYTAPLRNKLVNYELVERQSTSTSFSSVF
ncbi:LacI family transcriptional regulator [Marinomonas agarivorans]|nr:LacI family transcriptional regulator [Marinomonas agarivorans]